jgi:hypothetical protein
VGAKRPRAEFVQLLAEQRQALVASSENYDKGNEWEAARLAATVFNLVHDGGGIRSLLTQLGLRASLRFVSTGRIEPDPTGRRLSLSPPLIGFRGGSSGMRAVPHLGSFNTFQKLVQFETWWTKECIYRESGTELTRKRLVFSLRHQEGGGHIGDLTDPAYIGLKAGGGWYGGASDGSMRMLTEAAAASMRQVAWEITETLAQLGEVT